MARAWPRRQAEAKLATVAHQAEAFARDAEREFTTVAAPVLEKLGLAKAPARRPASARKSAARKPAKRATAAPAAKARKSPAKRPRAR